MAVGRTHFQHLRIFVIGRNVFERALLFIRDFNGIIRIQIHNLTALHINAGHPVGRCRENEGFVKAKIHRSEINLLIPVNGTSSISQSEMPFSNDSRMISGTLKKLRHCIQLRRNDTSGISGQNMRPAVPERIPSRQDTITGRRTYS